MWNEWWNRRLLSGSSGGKRWNWPRCIGDTQVLTRQGHTAAASVWFRFTSLPLTPCIASDHFRWWTSMSNVCNAKAVATFSTWDAKARRLVWQMSSRRWLLKLIAASTSCTLSYTVVSFVICLSLLERRSPNFSFRTDSISSLIDFLPPPELWIQCRTFPLEGGIGWNFVIHRDHCSMWRDYRCVCPLSWGHDCLEQLSGWLRGRWNYVLWAMWHDWDPDPKSCELGHDN